MNTVRALERLADRPHSTTELGRALGIDTRAARRLLQRLRVEGYVVQDLGHRRRYRATLRLVALGAHLLHRSTLPRIARPAMRALARQSAGTAHLWIAGPGAPVCVCCVDAADADPAAFVLHPAGETRAAVTVLGAERRDRRSCVYLHAAGTGTTAAAAVMDRGVVVAALELDGRLDVAATASVARAAGALGRALAGAT